MSARETPTGAGTDGEAGLDRLVKSGLAWSLANNAVERVVTLAAGIALARILDPRDYGVFAVALTAMMFLMSLNDIGLNQALVRWPGSLDRVGPTATTIIFGWSVLLCGSFMLAAAPFASAMGAPDAAPIVRLMALALVIDGVGAVPTATITRGLHQNRRTLAELGASLVGTPLTIGLAIGGLGPWALAWGQIVKNLISVTAMIIIAPKRYRPGWDSAHARELMRHGLPIAATTLLSFGLLNADYLVVGNILGATALGLYVFAYNLSSFPVTVFINAVRRVSLAGFSRLYHGGDGLQRGFTRAFTLTIAVVIPISLLIAALAPELVDFVYGSKWDGAVKVLTLLAVLGGIRAVLDLSSDLLIAVGHARWMLVIHGGWFLVLVPSLVVGANLGGIEGVGAAQLAVGAAVALPVYLVALHRSGMAIADIGRQSVRPLLGGAALLVIALALRSVIDGSFATLAVAGSGSFIVYLAIVSPMRHLARPEPADPTHTDPTAIAGGGGSDG